MTEQERVNLRRIRQNIITRLDEVENMMDGVYDDVIAIIQDTAQKTGEDIVLSYNDNMSKEQKAREIRSAIHQTDNPELENKIKTELKRGSEDKKERMAMLQSKIDGIYHDQLKLINDELKKVDFEKIKEQTNNINKSLLVHTTGKEYAIMVIEVTEEEINKNTNEYNEKLAEFGQKYGSIDEYDNKVKEFEKKLSDIDKMIKETENNPDFTDEMKEQALRGLKENKSNIQNEYNDMKKFHDMLEGYTSKNEELKKEIDNQKKDVEKYDKLIKETMAEKENIQNPQASIAAKEYNEDAENLKKILNEKGLNFEYSKASEDNNKNKEDIEKDNKEENSKEDNNQQKEQKGATNEVAATAASPKQQVVTLQAQPQQQLTPNGTGAAKNVLDAYNKFSSGEIAENLNDLRNLTALASALQEAQEDKNSNIDKKTLKDFKDKFLSNNASIVGKLSQDLFDSSRDGNDFTEKVVSLMSKLDGREKEDIEELVNSMYEGYNKFEGEDEKDKKDKKDKKRKLGKRKKENEADTRKEDVYGCVTPLLQGSLNKKEAQELSSIVTELSAKNDLSEEELETFEILKKQILAGYVYKTVDVMNRTPMSKFFNKINGSNKACIALAKNVTDIQNNEIAAKTKPAKEKLGDTLKKDVNDPTKIVSRNIEPVRKQQPPTR